jgi:hypothetical protein
MLPVDNEFHSPILRFGSAPRDGGLQTAAGDLLIVSSGHALHPVEEAAERYLRPHSNKSKQYGTPTACKAFPTSMMSVSGCGLGKLSAAKIARLN